MIFETKLYRQKSGALYYCSSSDPKCYYLCSRTTNRIMKQFFGLDTEKCKCLWIRLHRRPGRDRMPVKIPRHQPEFVGQNQDVRILPPNYKQGVDLDASWWPVAQYYRLVGKTVYVEVWYEEIGK